MAAATVTIKLMGGTAFAKGLKAAKRVGGKYDGATQTWAIPADKGELNAPGMYGWVIVRRTERGCWHYTADQGCPLHGESCAESTVSTCCSAHAHPYK